MNSEKSSSSVDEIQCSIDKMLLLVFESMRNCAFPQALDNSSASSESSTLAAEVVSAYEITASAIDNLLGIDSSPQEQLDQLVNYSNEYKIIKGRVLKLEEDLVSLHTDINQRVNEMLSDYEAANGNKQS